mmetsp:Transcript_31229/g.64726  ORF Transcript_31229/g.64726 Transcript_31229/m.64726 type:complete len:216 (+) Transcript_31229:2648-3295(+)
MSTTRDWGSRSIHPKADPGSTRLCIHHTLLLTDRSKDRENPRSSRPGSIHHCRHRRRSTAFPGRSSPWGLCTGRTTDHQGSCSRRRLSQGSTRRNTCRTLQQWGPHSKDHLRPRHSNRRRSTRRYRSSRSQRSPDRSSPSGRCTKCIPEAPDLRSKDSVPPHLPVGSIRHCTSHKKAKTDHRSTRPHHLRSSRPGSSRRCWRFRHSNLLSDRSSP